MAAPTFYGSAPAGLYSQRSSGTHNWTATPGASSKALVEWCQRESQYGEAHGTFGGLTLDHQPYEAPSGYQASRIAYLESITGKSSNTRSYTAGYGDDHAFMTCFLDHADDSIEMVDEENVTIAVGGTDDIVLDPGTYDCIAFICCSAPVGSTSTSYTPAPTVDHGKSVTERYRGYQLSNDVCTIHTCEVLASDGAVTFTAPANSSFTRRFAVALFGVDQGGGGSTKRPQAIIIA